MKKLVLNYPDDRPVPQLLTESGVDLIKEIPIKAITVKIEPFEYPHITIELDARVELVGDLHRVLYTGSVDVE